MKTDRHRTALNRKNLSRPIRLAIEHEVVTPARRLLDYGSGRGVDVELLAELGIKARGWDPTFSPRTRRTRTDIVNLGYVVNVIEAPAERIRTLQIAWSLTKSILIVSARLDFERDSAHTRAFADGWITVHKTFQKFFTQDELDHWIEDTIGSRPVAAGPGIFYVFREPHERETFIASRFRRRAPTPAVRQSDRLFTERQGELSPLIDFVAQRGRLPRQDELLQFGDAAESFGSVRRAFRVVLWATDTEAWRALQQRRSVDTLVYLALARFKGPVLNSGLPEAIRYDVRAFFGSFKEAIARSDRLLFSTGNRGALDFVMRSSLVGKLTPQAIYVHIDALEETPALLRVYEGCGRVVAGTVEGANIIKLSRDNPSVSYLSYPDFDSFGHPSLAESHVVDLLSLTIRQRNYRVSTNPPVLHRKEAMVSPTDERHTRFSSLTAAEEQAGLFGDTRHIGNRVGWESTLSDHGVTVLGHELVDLIG